MGSRGKLRVYLGAAPGVGKTYAMLGEGHRRAERGTDVVIGYIETHGRKHTAEMVGDLEVVPRREMTHRGATFTEMDLDAILARGPKVVLVDELAHSNIPGSRHEKRWQDVEELLAAGIEVITTVNVQHLESVNDVVEKITGAPQTETVPDAVVRAADQIELRDMTAEALRRRLAHGNVYAPEKIDAALANYFRAGNLNALRELALLWTADRVDDALQDYRDEHDIDSTWEARERVVVALTGGSEGETLIRRAARIAARSSGGELLAVHVARSDGLLRVDQGALARQRLLVESLGGTFHQVLGDDVPGSLLAFARAENATQLVLGDSRRAAWRRLLNLGVASTTVRESGDIDVHIVSHQNVRGRLALPTSRGGSVSKRRKLRGYLLAVVLPPLLTMTLIPVRGDVNLVSDMLVFLLLTVVVSLVGGLAPALIAAVAGSMLLNYYFTPPLHTLSIRETNNALALFIFILVAMLVSSTVDLAARRTRQAARAAAESRTLANLAGSVLAGSSALTEMLERVRETFGLTSVALVEKRDGAEPFVRAQAGAGPTVDADVVVPVEAGVTLALHGRLLEAEDHRLLGAFAAQVAVVLDRRRLAEEAAAAAPLAEANKMRTALLAAVGHDLRAPLAAAKAAVSGLRSPDIVLPEEDRGELLAAADESLDKLAGLVDNLLDMSRLQAGALSMAVEPVALDEVVARAVDDVVAGEPVGVDLAVDLPLVLADAGLVERVLANLVANAVRFSPAGTPPCVTGSHHGDRVQLRVVDRGPGIPESERDQVFLPFQRLGDTDNTTGIGLGLALSRGLAEAMGGTLEPEDTPGGGLTMVLTLAAAPEQDRDPGRRERTEEA
ncbi:MAG: sensor histidine kinase KdpD [Marmoricola sp.]|nr:sensor histidine kinase KdpD [Marmoricola sp.]